MCGLIGVAGNLELRDETVMKRMMWFSAIQRGDDSTGVAVVKKEKSEMLIAKQLGPPTELFDTSRFRTIFNNNTSKVFLGHTRKATFGEKSRMNAHPFEYGDIVGAHNGTIERASVEAISKELKESFTVDSQALIAAIAAWGPKEALAKCRGAWSIVWYDKTDDSLNFLRNDERPMIIAWSDDRKTLFWASEEWFIDTACTTILNERKLYTNTKGDTFFEHMPNLHYKYPLGNILTPPAKGLYKPTVRKVEGAALRTVVPFNSATDMDNSPWNRMGPHSAGVGRTIYRGISTSEQSGRDDKGVSVLTLWTDKADYGGIVSEEKFNNMVGTSGCSFCSEDIKFGAQGLQIFTAEGIVMCAKCSRSDSTQIHVPEITQQMLVAAKAS